MNTRIWWTVIILLFIVIVGLTYALVSMPAPTTNTSTSTPPVATTTTSIKSPLAARIVVTSPTPGSTVSKTFTVSGKAPGPWYFEASFPIKVVDPSNNFIGQGVAQAQSDWMTEADVPFTATVTVTGYSGPATLVLLKDNPSGMPENDDSVSIPIVIQ